MPACPCGKYQYAGCVQRQVYVTCYNQVYVDVYDELLPFTREDIATANKMWDRFTSDTGHHGNLPRPENFHVTPLEKISWITRHREELEPLLSWWKSTISKDIASSEVAA